MKKLKCKNCWTYTDKELIIKDNVYNYCSKSCRLEFARSKIREAKEKQKLKQKKVKEKKQNSISYLSKQADKLWSEVIRLKWVCEYDLCNKKEYLNAHHIFSRNNKRLRWSLINWICLCSWHHTFSSEFSPHQTPCEFTYRLEWYKSKEYLDELIIQKNTPLKVTSEYLLEVIAEFKEILKNNK